ncbi:c-type cytochrome biogenesis protein CcsB [Hazenella sp. IB182353]|nr:c-type cytochrome biogenesis protein CcsB [Polycladospora coralii]
MVQLMEYMLLATFFLYLIAAVAFVMGTRGSKEDDKTERMQKWQKIGVGITIAGALLHLGFIILRVLIGGHFPTSNMFEFTAFLCFASVIAFIVIYFLYRSAVLGAFVMPIVVVLLGYAAAFPRDIQPLIPALKSHWLYIHVTTAALGQGAFMVAFVAGFIYLIQRFGQNAKGKQAFWLETIMVLIVMFIGFSGVSLLFEATGYQSVYKHEVDGQLTEQEYELPPIVAPNGGIPEEITPFWGLKEALFEAPAWMIGQKAALTLNSVIWAIITGAILYVMLRLLIRKRMTQLVHPMTKKIDLELLDEITYRAIAIGFPLFTLGALIFAMIWAHEAWGRFWGWDPKETWALITWLFYSAYLHLRLSRGWIGTKSAWLAVGGFVIILINLIVVNLIIAGLHSYA